MKRRWMLRGLRIFLIAVVAISVISLIVMGLWNALIPELFHGPALTYWQALGVLVLAHILLRDGPPGRFGWHRDRWRKRFEERLAAMTPEEREKFKQEWGGRCGPWHEQEPVSREQH